MCNVAGVDGKNAAWILRELLLRGQQRGEHATSAISKTLNPPRYIYESSDPNRVNYHKLNDTDTLKPTYYCTISNHGLVNDVLTDKIISDLHGKQAIGGNRYPSTGDDHSYQNTKNPRRYKGVAWGENGDILNAVDIRDFLIAHGIIDFSSDSDVEDGTKLFYYYYELTGDGLEAMKLLMKHIKGEYFIVALTPDSLLFAKGFNQVRSGGVIEVDLPDLGRLILGCSENSAAKGYLNIKDSEFRKLWHELSGGEIYQYFNDGDKDNFKFKKKDLPSWINSLGDHICHLDPKYIMRPDTLIRSINKIISVGEYRYEHGKEWAKDKDIMPKDVKEKIDFVVPVLDSGLYGAFGVVAGLQECGYKAKLKFGLVRNKYFSRTFLQSISKSTTKDNLCEDNLYTSYYDGDPFLNKFFDDNNQFMTFLGMLYQKAGQERSRREKVRRKLEPLSTGPEVWLLIDDSIMRRNTSKEVVKLIKEKTEVTEVYFGVMDDLVISDCPCAVDLGNNLIATNVYEALTALKLPNHRNNIIKIIEKSINADGLFYSNKNLEKKFFNDPCLGCLGADFPPGIYLRPRNIHG